jgi:hypothetical protein
MKEMHNASESEEAIASRSSEGEKATVAETPECGKVTVTEAPENERATAVEIADVAYVVRELTARSPRMIQWLPVIRLVAEDVTDVIVRELTARSRWIIQWLAFIPLVAVAGAFFWTTDRAEKDAQREQMVDAALETLVRAIDNRAEIAGTSDKQSVDAKPKETEHSVPEEEPVRTEKTRASTLEKPAAAVQENTDAKQSDGVPPGNGNLIFEPVDRVGTVSVPKRSEVDSGKPTGPPGCTQFRSFDPVSGTYTTFDGRRRQCR